MYFEGTYLVKWFLHNLQPCSDIEFAQLYRIIKAGEIFAEVAAVSERCLSRNIEI